MSNFWYFLVNHPIRFLLRRKCFAIRSMWASEWFLFNAKWTIYGYIMVKRRYIW